MSERHGIAPRVCAGEDIEGWEALDLLSVLVDKSLVIYEEGAGQGRYRLPETVRQYTQERLLERREGESVRKRYRDYFLEMAEEAAKLLGPGLAEWIERLMAKHDNLRAAISWCLGDKRRRREGIEAGRIAVAVLGGAGDLSEGREYLQAALSAKARPPAPKHGPMP